MLPLRPMPTFRGVSKSLALLVLLLWGHASMAQIEHKKPRSIEAENRRAVRENRDADVPYKDSHLDIDRDKSQRGHSDQSRAERKAKVNSYDHGLAPNAKGPGMFGLRNLKKGSKKGHKDKAKEEAKK